MSMQFSPEDIARIRDHARLLIQRSDVHEESLEGLVRATDTEYATPKPRSLPLSGEAAIVPSGKRCARPGSAAAR